MARIYEQLRPLIIWLGLLELAWLGCWFCSLPDKKALYVIFVIIWIVLMLVWMPLTITMARRGMYLKYSPFFSNLIGFSLVVLFPSVLVLSSDIGASEVVRAAENVPETQLIAFHIMRLLAVGTLIKFYQGELPLHFVLCGSIPDLMFGLSAVVLTVAGMNNSVSNELLIVWHSVGIGVFFGAGISMFFSVASPIRIFRGQPDTRLVFEFPMVLAPNYTVPLFVVAHMFALVKIYGAE